MSDLESNLASDVKSGLETTYETGRRLAADLGALAASWVRYGVTVGESAVSQSARTLDETARALRKVADRLKAGG